MSSGGTCVGCGGPVPLNENLCEICLDDGSATCIDCGGPCNDVLGRCETCVGKRRDRLPDIRLRYETEEDRTLSQRDEEGDWRDAHAWDENGDD